MKMRVMSRRTSHIFYAVLTAIQLSLFLPRLVLGDSLLAGGTIFSFACLVLTLFSWWLGARSLRTYERIKQGQDEFYANLHKLYETQIWDRHDHQ